MKLSVLCVIGLGILWQHQIIACPTDENRLPERKTIYYTNPQSYMDKAEIIKKHQKLLQKSVVVKALKTILKRDNLKSNSQGGPVRDANEHGAHEGGAK